MTKHELLSLLSEETQPDKSLGLHGWDIADYFDYSRDSTYGRLWRMRKQGLVWRVAGRWGNLYGITIKGQDRLDWFEDNGCGWQGCGLC